MTNPGERMRSGWPKPAAANDADPYSEVCRCGVVVALSNTWWHRSVCPAWQEECRPVESMVEVVARAVAISEGAGEENWEAYVDMARPAIKAMRVPTAAMIDSGATSVWNRDALVAAYQAMIDAAAGAG